MSGPTQGRCKSRAKILFVDDEQRVLNSMRALFRRDYDVYITTEGAAAIQLLKNETIDVIVADQRMPGMTGVEVLGATRQVSPNTVRILLTGYADLDAIEGSINVGEVFRFLSKPCPPNHLRETIRLAVDIAHASVDAGDAVPVKPPVTPTTARLNGKPLPVARSAVKTAATAAPRRDTAGTDTIARDDRPVTTAVDETFCTTTVAEEIVLSTAGEARGESTEIVLCSDRTEIVDSTGVHRALDPAVARVGVVVFSASDSFANAATHMLSREHLARAATTLVEVTEILEQGEAGVLVTDFVSDGRLLRKMLSTLKRYLPELITIVISNDRDAKEMISLINEGQVFRYMSKPAKTSRFMQNVNAAVIKHIQLRENPELLQRYQVEQTRAIGDMPTAVLNFLGRIKGMRRLLLRG